MSNTFTEKNIDDLYAANISMKYGVEIEPDQAKAKIRKILSGMGLTPRD